MSMPVKSDLSQEYQEFLKDNKDIGSSVQATIKGLIDGKTPMQIEDLLFDFDLSANHVAKIATAIVKYSGRGDEFSTYWIKRNNLPVTTDLIAAPAGFPIAKRPS